MRRCWTSTPVIQCCTNSNSNSQSCKRLVIPKGLVIQKRLVSQKRLVIQKRLIIQEGFLVYSTFNFIWRKVSFFHFWLVFSPLLLHYWSHILSWAVRLICFAWLLVVQVLKFIQFRSAVKATGWLAGCLIQSNPLLVIEF